MVTCCTAVVLAALTATAELPMAGDAGEGGADAGVAQAAPSPSAVDAGTPAARDAKAAAPLPRSKPTPAAKAVKPQPSQASAPLDLSFLAPVPATIDAMYYDLSVTTAHLSTGFPEGGMRLVGARFLERNSGLGKMLTYVVTQLLMAVGEGVAASQGRYVGSTYGVGYRVDYYRSYTSAELASMRANREQAGDNLLASNMSLDLQLFLPVQGVSTASGISAELTPVTVNFTGDGVFGLEVAFQYTKVTDALPGAPARLRSFESIGTPVRLMLNLPVVQVQLQWSPNFIGGFGINPKVMENKYLESVQGTGNLLYTNSPLSLSATVSPVPWVFVRGTGTWTKYQLTTDALGYQLEAGLRF